MVNVNLQLSERLLEVTSRRHPDEVQRTLIEVVSEQGSHSKLLDNTEILLNPALWLAALPSYRNNFPTPRLTLAIQRISSIFHHQASFGVFQTPRIVSE